MLRFNRMIPATINNSIVQGLTGPKSDIPVPSVVDQVDSFLSTSFNETEPCSTLAILVAGVNDAIFGGPALNVQALTDSLVNSVKLLTTKGASSAKQLVDLIKRSFLYRFPHICLASNAAGRIVAFLFTLFHPRSYRCSEAILGGFQGQSHDIA